MGDGRRRWRLTSTDLLVLAAGALLVAAGAVVTAGAADTRGWAFFAALLLDVGVAVALVGIVLRIQLDLQDELDDSRRARLRFENEMRSDLRRVDRRVSEALASKAVERSPTGAQLPRQVTELLDQLDITRRQVSALEQELLRSRSERRQPRARAIRIAPGRFKRIAAKVGGVIGTATFWLVGTALLAASLIGLGALTAAIVPGAERHLAAHGIWHPLRRAMGVDAVLVSLCAALLSTRKWPEWILLAVGYLAFLNLILVVVHFWPKVF